MLLSDVSLPSSVLDRADIARMVRELQEFDEQAHQAKLRGTKAPTAAHVSDSVRETAELFNASLQTSRDRAELVKKLQYLHREAPLVHLSFAVQPAEHVIERILEWFRANAHPSMLVQVGLQPSLVGGCLVRTTNKVFDFSFADTLTDAQHVIADGVSKL